MTSRNKNNWFDVDELAPGLFGIAEFGHIEKVISFLLIGTERCLLIDTGMGFFSMKEIVQKITSLPCQVLNTHSHFDHVGSNFEFTEVAMFDHPANRKAANEGFAPNYLARWAAVDQFGGEPPAGMSFPYAVSSFPHAQFFCEGEIFSAAPFALQAIHTPGHCDDSVCFFEAQHGWLFTGDLLYEGSIYLEKEGGLSKFRRSIEKIKQLNNLRRIFSSHNAFEFPVERLELLQGALTEVTAAELDTEVTIGSELKLVPS
ncbi:MBL fold metallo-hydrolase [Oligoflexia bacterium]|nr:MBL fold metallo-hydrolase [Oligoflexia bacterium]